MAKRSVLKITPILITLNVVVLIIIIGFYSFRLIKYYKLEHGSKNNEETLLVDEVIKKQSYVDLTKGLIFDEANKIYRYKGKIEDNYVLYSGILYRIMSIDENKNIKLISDNNLTIMYSGLENGYDKSYINKWLNKSEEKYSGIFENSLYNGENLLTNTSLCSETIDSVEKITCNEKNSNNKITLMSLYDYKEALGSSSYLNNGEAFYLATSNSNKENYYVTSSGEVSLNSSNTKVSGVRAVITIKGNVKLLSGNGKESNPYEIENHEISTLNKTYIGNIISIGNNNYKVVEVNDDKVKVVSLDAIKDGENNLEMAFDSSTSSYSSKTKIGKYLNNDYLNTINQNDLIVKADWYTGTLSLGALDYSLVYSSKISEKVGMLTLGDFYVQDLNNIFTISRGIESSSIINVINSEGNIYGDFVTSKYNLRPAFYLKGDAKIIKGIGTIDGPYELGE